MMHLTRLLQISASAVLLAACGGAGGADPAASLDQSPQEAALSQSLCDLLPGADAEKIMGKALVQRRNDASGCHYEDARGTSGTGLWIYLNAFQVSDQCRLTPGSEPLSGVGSEACIAIGHPAGLYTTVVFRAGGRTFEAVAPGQDRTSELATAVARAVSSKLGA